MSKSLLKYNKLHIIPTPLYNNIHTYYCGVFQKNKHELTEVDETPFKTAIQDYFPLIVQNMNKRGNWEFIDTNDAIHRQHLDFVWTNAIQIDMHASVHSRIMLDSIDHYISNKKAFYNKFKGHDFIPLYVSLNKHITLTQQEKMNGMFVGKSVIVKPDKGARGSNILILPEYNFEKVKEYVETIPFSEWTVSEVTMPKLCNDYIVSNRIYFLVVKENNKTVNGYYYSEFMNYIPYCRYTGDMTDKYQFITNYYMPTDGEDNDVDEEDYVRNRFISHAKWMDMFTDGEQKCIYEKLDEIFAKITCVMRDDILCSNDNKKVNDKMGFHVYGADILIDNNLNIKVLEINGAPTINDETVLYHVDGRMDDFQLMDDVLELTVDKIFKPLNVKTTVNKFRKVYSGEISRGCEILYYIPNSICVSYPFIYKALKKRMYMKRTKNIYDNIDLFYGAREKYVENDTSLNYYDELLNYKSSEIMTNAKIINKVQGLTYFLANKGRIYERLKKHVYDYILFHPVSQIFFYDNNTNKTKGVMEDFMLENRRISKWIVKPVHGSRGAGIRIFDMGDGERRYVVDDVIDHMHKYSIDGVDMVGKVVSKTNGKERDKIEKVKYNYWIISQYLDRPYLMNNKKCNIRFYVLLTINGKLPTYENLTNYDPKSDVMNIYVLNDCIVYFSILDYNSTVVPDEFVGLDDNMIDKMRNLTNLEIINDIHKVLPNINVGGLKSKSTCMLNELLKDNDRLLNQIRKQGINIIKKTLESIKYELRPLNRFADGYKGCFNLLAYDTMLDYKENLWFIEVNRGPDMKALELNLGEKMCVDIFDEIFRVCVDRYYVDGIDCDRLKYFSKVQLGYNVVELDR